MDSTVEFWTHSAMPYVETRRACQSRICYQSHSHPTFSIGAVDEGQSCFSSAFGKNEIIKAKSIVVIPAHVEHSCNPFSNQAWSYQMMHLDAAWLMRLLNELEMEIGKTCTQQMTPFPKLRPKIIHHVKVYEAFTELNQILFDKKISLFEKEQSLIQVLTDILIPNFEWESISFSGYFQQYLPDLILHLQSDVENLSLTHLAEKMKISRYALIRLFKHYFGFTPHAYQLNNKINQARERLKVGADIAQVAYELEFVDQSHFHRVFKRLTGVTPKQYSKKV